MKKSEKNSGMYKKLSKKDTLIIAVSIVALIVLSAVIIYSKNEENKKQEQLDDINKQISADGDKYYVDEALGSLVINEVNQKGYVELYNSGNKSIDISFTKLYIDGSLKYTTPANTTLDSKQFYVIETDEVLGEKQCLVSVNNQEHKCITQLIVPKLSENESFGRKSDAGTTVLFMTGTKGESNTNATINNKDELMFSVPGGFYESAVNVELLAKENTKIYYTTDGTEPTTESKLYEGPIKITNKSGSNYEYAGILDTSLGNRFVPASINIGTVIKAMAVYPSGKKSEVLTESYFVGFGFGKSYANIPVISITMNEEDLFNYFTGIYVLGRSYEDAAALGKSVENAGNFYNGWVKTAYLEYFEPNKQKSYGGKINISVLTDYSVGSNQKSFLINGKDYIASKGSSLYSYLNGASSQFRLTTNKRDNNYKIREYIVKQLLENTSVAAQNINPCTLFINGEYWGGYMLVENIDKEFIKEKYGIDNDIVVAYNGNSKLNGDDAYSIQKLYKFVEQKDLSDDNNYNKVGEMMDIQSYLDYYCVNIFLANTDFGYEEAAAWKTATKTGDGYNDGRWRWIIGKMDNTMNNAVIGNYSTSSIDTYLQSGVMNDDLFWGLMKNKKFRNQLKTTMEKFVNDVFDYTEVEKVIDNTAALMEKFTISSINRFAGNVSDDFYSSEVEKIKAFFEERGEYALFYTDEIIEKGTAVYGGAYEKSKKDNKETTKGNEE